MGRLAAHEIPKWLDEKEKKYFDKVQETYLPEKAILQSGIG